MATGSAGRLPAIGRLQPSISPECWADAHCNDCAPPLRGATALSSHPFTGAREAIARGHVGMDGVTPPLPAVSERAATFLDGLDWRVPVSHGNFAKYP